MDAATSADGTLIAYDERGEGPTVVIVNGALSLAADAGEIADALADAGFRAVTWDRRARGASGDKRGSTPEDEAADLAAVIDAVGGDAVVLGHSSGAVLALFAASLGVPVRALFLSEPPFRWGDDEPAQDLAERLQASSTTGAVRMLWRPSSSRASAFLKRWSTPVARAVSSRPSPRSDSRRCTTCCSPVRCRCRPPRCWA